MSRGHGHVATTLIKIFRDEPSGVFSTSELCRRVYGLDRVEKKHRVAVIRAMRRLANNEFAFVRRRVLEGEKTDDVYFNMMFWGGLRSRPL